MKIDVRGVYAGRRYRSTTVQFGHSLAFTRSQIRVNLNNIVFAKNKGSVP